MFDFSLERKESKKKHWSLQNTRGGLGLMLIIYSKEFAETRRPWFYTGLKIQFLVWGPVQKLQTRKLRTTQRLMAWIAIYKTKMQKKWPLKIISTEDRTIIYIYLFIYTHIHMIWIHPPPSKSGKQKVYKCNNPGGDRYSVGWWFT